ncbi:Aldose 1-epimerase [Zea mays]|uniref:Aldose 1-epimerase n=1 Tax=Zea mays TaxID=4577 RepID=A0A3L6EHX4_MAIZE|nr:Aldose 1-epimerase [Zea mays]
MEQLVGVHHHHHSLSPRAPRTPTRPQPQPQPHPLLHHLPSNRFRDLHSQIHNHIHPAVPAASRVLRATPPFFLILLAAVYLLASVTIFSAPTPLLRLRLASPRPLILPKPAPPPPPPAPELFDLDGGSVRVRLTNVGAAVTSFLVPDKNGVLADVVLGFDSLDPYLNGTSPYFGCIVGRVANRIKDGKFTLNGVQYNLSINNPPNTLHGGFKGFDKTIWEVAEYNKGDKPSITFKYYSKDGEEGYPGDVSVTARYSLLPSATLKLEMEAIPLNKATPISLAQHTYWNLAGHSSGDVLSHSVQIWGSQITPVDQTSIPTGELMPVTGTPFDFLTGTRIGSRIDQVPGGYDHNYMVDSGEVRSGLRHVAHVADPSSSRALDIWADAPGVQFYTGNSLGGVVGKGGAVYGKHAGLCLETQGFPNAVNQPSFPSVVFGPGERYSHTMLFELSTE